MWLRFYASDLFSCLITTPSSIVIARRRRDIENSLSLTRFRGEAQADEIIVLTLLSRNADVGFS